MSKVFFNEAGSGPALVFLHGFCDTHEFWTEFVVPFTKNFRVLVPDLPGFGKSAMLPLPFTIDQVGDELAAWVSDQQGNGAIVVGHSLGGYVALSLLERHEPLLAGIVLFHSTPRADTTERKAVRNKVTDFVNAHGVPPYVDTLAPGLFANPKDPNIEQTRNRMMGTKAETLIGYAAAMRDRPDRSYLFEGSRLPKLVIGGAQDALIPLDDLKNLIRTATNSSLFEVPEAAHMGVFEAKSKCQEAISRFAAETIG